MLRNTSTNGWFIGRGEDEESERRRAMNRMVKMTLK